MTPGPLFQSALAVFATSGVDAPVREIAEKAGVDVGTVYRHFRSAPTSLLPSSAVRSTPAQTPGAPSSGAKFLRRCGTQCEAPYGRAENRYSVTPYHLLTPQGAAPQARVSKDAPERTNDASFWIILRHAMLRIAA